MRLSDINQTDSITEARLVWRRVGNKLVRGVRCTSGRRKGRVVAIAAQCTAPIDIKKRMVLKKTRARLASRMARKARRTRRINPASRRLRTLNK